MISISIDHSLNRRGLMRSCRPPIQPRGGSSNLNRPLNFFRQKMTTQDQTHRLLLAVQRPASRGPNVVRRGHEQSIGELRAIRFGQERVDFSLGDRSVGMIRLGLNGPQFTRPRASDNVSSLTLRVTGLRHRYRRIVLPQKVSHFPVSKSGIVNALSVPNHLPRFAGRTIAFVVGYCFCRLATKAQSPRRRPCVICLG